MIYTLTSGEALRFFSIHANPDYFSQHKFILVGFNFSFGADVLAIGSEESVEIYEERVKLSGSRGGE